MKRLLELAGLHGRLAGVAAVAALALGAAFAPAAASAEVNFRQYYSVQSLYDINNIVVLQYVVDGGGSSNSYHVDAGSSVFEDGFAKTKLITDTYFLGVSYLGDESETPAEHLVLAVDDTYAGGLIGNPFEDVFAGWITSVSTESYTYGETDLIAALNLLATPDFALDDPNYAAQMAAKEDAYGLIGGFSDSVRSGGGTFGSVDTFTLVGFSDGQRAGSGSSYITGSVSGAVPEPATWALMIAGFGGAGAMLRRRRAKDTFVAA